MGAIYFHAIACGTLYRPITFYTSRKRQPYDEVEANIARTTTEKLVNKNTEQDSESTDANITVQLNNRNDSTDIFTEESTKLVNEKEDRFFREKMSTVSNGIDINNDASNRNNGTGELDETREENTNRCIEMVESNNLLNPSMESDKIQKRKCATSFTQFLLKVLDFRVCKDPVVIVFVMAGFLLFFGYCNFVMFMPATAEAEGITKSRTAWLVSINGLTDLVGKTNPFHADTNRLLNVSSAALSKMLQSRSKLLKLLPECRTSWIRMKYRVTRRLIRIQDD